MTARPSQVDGISGDPAVGTESDPARPADGPGTRGTVPASRTADRPGPPAAYGADRLRTADHDTTGSPDRRSRPGLGPTP
ncbi:hypothetical protein [Polymorphospora rubra]|uniref:hypothetical protein n=1 Tax=Polymorphospora rubra TaxID=338584 RepID=UPI001BB325BC|nr:hypothetical protein [Polymorphospora rubra]